MKWLSQAVLVVVHQQQILEHDGAGGIRSPELLESALARPRNKFEYEDATLHACAAAYGFGLIKNHPFVDGNKRIALLAMFIFLRINGHLLDAPEAEVYAVIIALAGGELTEEGLMKWLTQKTRPV